MTEIMDTSHKCAFNEQIIIATKTANIDSKRFDNNRKSIS